MAEIEEGDRVTVKAEVTKIMDGGETIIVQINGAAARVAVYRSEIATVTKPKKWTPPRDKPD